MLRSIIWASLFLANLSGSRADNRLDDQRDDVTVTITAGPEPVTEDVFTPITYTITTTTATETVIYCPECPEGKMTKTVFVVQTITTCPSSQFPSPTVSSSSIAGMLDARPSGFSYVL